MVKGREKTYQNLAGEIALGALIGFTAVGTIGAGSGVYSAVVANRERICSWRGPFQQRWLETLQASKQEH